MSLFVCEICGAIENTALGCYHAKNLNLFTPELNGKALCSECTPEVYGDGTPCEKGGKWHGRFPKRIATKELVKEIGRSNFVDLPKEFR